MTSGARLLGRHKRTWLALAATLLAAIAAAFNPLPAAIDATGGAQQTAFAALASAAIVTLAVLPFFLWPGVAQPKIWAAVAVAALTLGLGSFLGSAFVQRACTARYADRAVVIGTELTALGASYTQANPDLSNDDLLFDAAGVPGRIWTASSIGRCGAFITGSYFLWIPFLVVCLLATAQAAPTTILAPVRWDAQPPTLAPAAPIRYDVFVSYRHGGVDKTFATELVAALEADGYRVAIDERDFAANASFLREMERVIRESRITVAVISNRYLESGNTEEEVLISKVLDMGDRRRRLIPIIIEPVALPVWLYGIVGIDWTKPDPLVDPLEKLKATLGTPLAASTSIAES
jgi:TIR domain-containing protein